MNTAAAIAAVATLLQLQEPPAWTNAIPIIEPYMPDAVYAGVVVVDETMTYAGGLDWQIGTRWGAGAEYRHCPAHVRFGSSRYRAVTHAAGGYLYRELPAWGRLALRTEAGGAVVWMDSDLRTSSTWAVGVRATGHFGLTERLALAAWVGSLRVGSSTATDGRLHASRGRAELIESGVALRWRL